MTQRETQIHAGIVLPEDCPSGSQRRPDRTICPEHPMRTRLLAVIASLVLAACAANPGPGQSGYAFNLSGAYTGQFVVDGQALPAAIELETLDGGAVQGGFEISMLGIGGEIEGELIADQLTFSAAYHNPESSCDGVAVAQATVTDGGSAFRGRIEVTECGNFLSGTLRFSR